MRRWIVFWRRVVPANIDNILDRAVQSKAELFQSKCGDTLIMPEHIDGTAIKSIFIYKCVGRFSLFGQSLPERAVRYHVPSPCGAVILAVQ